MLLKEVEEVDTFAYTSTNMQQASVQQDSVKLRRPSKSSTPGTKRRRPRPESFGPRPESVDIANFIQARIDLAESEDIGQADTLLHYGYEGDGKLK